MKPVSFFKCSFLLFYSSERFHYNGFLPDTLNSSYHEVDLNAEPPPSDADVVIIDGQQSRTLKDKELLQQAQREEDDSDEELDFYEASPSQRLLPLSETHVGFFIV